MPLSDDDVREILRIIEESELDELQIETEGFTLRFVRGGAGPRSAAAPPPAAQPARADATDVSLQSDGLVTIDSPMLGTFYRAEAPGAEPFVEVGSRVEPDTIVCIIEVMKMMNSIPSGTRGEIVAVCPDNGELVEYGAPLFRVRPS